jgi:hypothetical protein
MCFGSEHEHEAGLNASCAGSTRASALALKRDGRIKSGHDDWKLRIIAVRHADES